MHDEPANKKHVLASFLKTVPVHDYLSDPLHKNAIFLIANSAINGLAGFFFWTLAARLYTVEDVGRATALVSAGNLLAILAGMGIGVGLIRFLAAEKNKTLLINSAITVGGGTAFILSILFLIGLNFWSPALNFIGNSYLLIAVFIIFCIFNVVYAMQLSVFIAFRTAKYAFYQGSLVAIKIILVIVLVGMSVTGIFSAFALGAIIAVLAANLFIRRVYPDYRLMPAFDRPILKEIFSFSFGNYFGDVFQALSSFLMPLIVINILGPEKNAYYYISWMIATLLFTVAYATNSSLVAETSFNPAQLRKQVFKALKFDFIILVPAVVILYFGGGLLISFFGAHYAREGLELLRILIISSIPLAISELGVAVFRIQKRIKPIILVYGVQALGTIVIGYILMGIMGLPGVGIAWLSANVITIVIVLIFNIKHLLPTTGKMPWQR